jgi:predicted protein tyrosine phosphatase
MNRDAVIRATATGLAVAFLLDRIRRDFALTRAHTALRRLMTGRLQVPHGLCASEMDTEDTRLRLPASLGPDGRLLLGDLGHVEFLLEGGGGDLFARHQQQHKIVAVLVCMGGAASAVSKELRKKGLAYHGLDGCEDSEGYPLLERHLSEACTFLRAQLAAAARDGGCVLIHCHEGKNRSATLAVAYLMVEHRMRLAEAVGHVWRKRPIILSNQSFVQQLVELAATEGLL